MSTYIKTGNTFDVHPEDAIDQHKKLPVGTYTIMSSMERGLYLERVGDLSVNHKVYGNPEEMSDRILNTYSERANNTGVLLSGNKGSGKTVLGKMVAQKAIEKGMIVIYVTVPFTGPQFNRLISSIEQPCLVMIDEFEKVYSQIKDQEALLTLFDGLYPSKKLFLVTVNETDKMTPYLLNRPGRFFYHLKYAGLTYDQIVEFVRDNVKDEQKHEMTIRACRMIKGLSYDALKAITEEMNRYAEDINDVLQFLNIEITSKKVAHEIIEFSYKGVKNPIIPRTKTYPFAPLSESTEIYWYRSKAGQRSGDSEYLNFTPEDIVSFDGDKIIYENDEYRAVIKEIGDRKDQSKNLLLKTIKTSTEQQQQPIPFDGMVKSVNDFSAADFFAKKA